MGGGEGKEKGEEKGKGKEDEWDATNGCGAVLDYLELPQKMHDLRGSVDLKAAKALSKSAEILSRKFQDMEPRKLKSTFACQRKRGGGGRHIDCCRIDCWKQRQIRSITFGNIRGKLAVMRLQLLTLVKGGEIDWGKIGEVEEASKVILDAALVGGTIHDGREVFVNELSSVRALATFVIETM